MVSVHPARSTGLGDGVGDCHDVTNLTRVCLFSSLVFLYGGKNLTLF